MIFRILRKIAAAYFILYISLNNALAESLEVGEAAAFANFIRELIHTTNSSINSSNICIFGNDEISKSIMLQEKDAIDLNFELKKYETCKAIYVSQNMQKIMRSEIEKFSSKKIMTIAIFEGFIELGGTAQVQMGRRNFELILDPKQIKASGIKLNALFLSLVIN
jgi:hypothetical protein